MLERRERLKSFRSSSVRVKESDVVLVGQTISEHVATDSNAHLVSILKDMEWDA